MGAITRAVKVAVTDKGGCPFIDWYSALDKSLRSRVAARIMRLASGNPGNSRNLRFGVKEAKQDDGSRIYWMDLDEELVVLLAGGNKKNQSADILLAESLALELTKNTGAKDGLLKRLRNLFG